MKKFSSELPYLYIRDRIFIYRRVFKPEHQALTGKREYKISLKTRDRNKALSAYNLAEDYFNSLISGLNSGVISNNYAPTIEELTCKAQTLGLDYIPHTQLGNLSNKEKVQRIIAINNSPVHDFKNIQAGFGSIASANTLAAALAFYESDNEYIYSKLNKREKDAKINPKKNKQ